MKIKVETKDFIAKIHEVNKEKVTPKYIYIRGENTSPILNKYFTADWVIAFCCVVMLATLFFFVVLIFIILG